MPFQFELGDTVNVLPTNYSGTVIGRSQFTKSESNYLVRHTNGDGDQVEKWYSETALSK